MKAWLATLIPVLTPVIVPLVVAGLRGISTWLKASTWGGPLTPLLAVGLGVLLDYLNLLATGSSLGPAGGAVLGGMGVAIREIVDQFRQSTGLK